MPKLPSLSRFLIALFLVLTAGVTAHASGIRHSFLADGQSLSVQVPQRLCLWSDHDRLPIGPYRQKIKDMGVEVSLVLVDCRDVDKLPALAPGDKFDAVIVAPLKIRGRRIMTGSTEAAALSLYLRQFMTLKPDLQKELLIDVLGAQFLPENAAAQDIARRSNLQIVPGRSEPHIRGELALGKAGAAFGTATIAPLGPVMGVFLSVSGNRPTDLDRLQRELDGLALSIRG